MKSAAWLCLIGLISGLSNPQNVCKHASAIEQASFEWGIDAHWLIAIGEVESRWSSKCDIEDARTSDSCNYLGNVGTFQIQRRFSGSNPSKVYDRRGYETVGVEVLMNPSLAVQVTARLLTVWIQDYRLDIEGAVCAYNVGGRGCREKKGRFYLSNVQRVKDRLDTSRDSFDRMTTPEP